MKYSRASTLPVKTLGLFGFAVHGQGQQQGAPRCLVIKLNVPVWLQQSAEFVLGPYPCGVTARKLNRRGFGGLCRFPFTLLRCTMSTQASNAIQNYPLVTVPGVEERHDPCGGLKINWTACGTYRTDQVPQPTDTTIDTLAATTAALSFSSHHKYTRLRQEFGSSMGLFTLRACESLFLHRHSKI